MRRIRAFAGRHRLGVSLASVVAVGLVVFVLLYFQPQKLFINQTVNEGFPSPAPSSAAQGTTLVEVASGSFRSLEHHTTGEVHVLRLANGSLVLRLADLKTSNGPRLRVYLSPVSADKGLRDYGTGYVDLGGLKGNRGNQNYAIPRGTDLTSYRSVVIWCSRFHVGFGVAGIEGGRR